jgi:hypothetical protein
VAMQSAHCVMKLLVILAVADLVRAYTVLADGQADLPVLTANNTSHEGQRPDY